MESSRLILLDNLGGLKRGRLWYNQLPFRLRSDAKIINGSFNKSCIVTTGSFQLCCEIALLPREVSNYGLLGLEFFPSFGNNIEYEISYFEQPRDILIETLALKTDQVFIGIPRDFAISIKEEIERSIGFTMPNGLYSFVTSAHGVVGSSKAVFSKLTSMLIQLVINDPTSLDLKKIKEILADELKK